MINLNLKSTLGRAVTQAEVDENFTMLEWQFGESPLIIPMEWRAMAGEGLDFSIENFSIFAYYAGTPIIGWGGDNYFTLQIDATGTFKLYNYEAGRMPKSIEFPIFAHEFVSYFNISLSDYHTNMPFGTSGFIPQGAIGEICSVGFTAQIQTLYALSCRSAIFKSYHTFWDNIVWRYSDTTVFYLRWDYVSYPLSSKMVVVDEDNTMWEFITANHTVIDDRRFLLSDIFGDGSCTNFYKCQSLLDENTMVDELGGLNLTSDGTLSQINMIEDIRTPYFSHHIQCEGYGNFMSSADFPLLGDDWTIMITMKIQRIYLNNEKYFITLGDNTVKNGIQFKIYRNATQMAFKVTANQDNYISPLVYVPFDEAEDFVTMIFDHNDATDVATVNIDGVDISTHNIAILARGEPISLGTEAHGGQAQVRFFNKILTPSEKTLLAQQNLSRIDLDGSRPSKAVWMGHGAIPESFRVQDTLYQEPYDFTRNNSIITYDNIGVDIPVGGQVLAEISCETILGLQTEIILSQIDIDKEI